jgi:hypothetical protein
MCKISRASTQARGGAAIRAGDLRVPAERVAS